MSTNIPSNNNNDFQIDTEQTSYTQQSQSPRENNGNLHGRTVEDLTNPSNPATKRNSISFEINENDNKDPSVKKKGCDWQSVIKWGCVALAVIGLIAGTIGIFSAFGLFQSAIGSISTLTGLYVTIGGYGVTLISGILLSVYALLNRSKEAKANGVEADIQGPTTIINTTRPSRNCPSIPCFKRQKYESV